MPNSCENYYYKLDPISPLSNGKQNYHTWVYGVGFPSQTTKFRLALVIQIENTYRVMNQRLALVGKRFLERM